MKRVRAEWWGVEARPMGEESKPQEIRVKEGRPLPQNGPYRVGQVVRIVQQPVGQSHHVQGLVGFIDELRGNDCYVQALRLDGTSAGAGSVPLECIVPEMDEAWLDAKQKYEDYLARLEREAMERTERFGAIVSRVAKKHGVTAEVARAIYEDIGRLWVGP